MDDQTPFTSEDDKAAEMLSVSFGDGDEIIVRTGKRFVTFDVMIDGEWEPGLLLPDDFRDYEAGMEKVRRARARKREG